MQRLAPVFALSACVACGGGLFSIFDDDDERGASERSGGASNGSFGGLLSDSDAGAGGGPCSPNLTGLVRDFRPKGAAGGHPDFEAFEAPSPTKGLVARQLGPDKKPVFASTTGDGSHGRQLTGKAEFDQWYRNVDGVNQAFEYVLPLKSGANGIATFSSNAFFPVDGRGFGNSGKDADGASHNFHFTFELHLEFVYRGGETFTFTGDDDLWAFFNGKLGIDLGGLHPASSATVKLDEVASDLGIERGKTYSLDVFHAERHTSASNFRVDTTLEFVNCGAILVPN